MKIKSQRALRWTTALALLSCFLEGHSYPARAQTETARATITIDAGAASGPISPLLYGQFIEFMFEGVKVGLHAELLPNRGFEEQPNVIGLSRYWERYPDDRNDDYGLSFAWDEAVHYPDKQRPDTQIAEHSLRVHVGDGVI